MFIHNPLRPSRYKGFSFIELVIVIIILGIISLLVINLPLETLRKTQAQTTTQSLTHILTASRNQAVSLFTNVIVCPSKDDQTCHKDWSSNLMSFIDRNGNNRRDSNEPVNFRHYSAPELEVHYTRQISSLKFSPTGSVNNNGSFTICPGEGDDKLIHILIINRQGRVRTARDADGDGIVENSKGDKANCPSL